MSSHSERHTSPGWFALWAIPFVVLAVSHWNWGPTADMGDYAQYLLHAQALADGRPYAETGYIFHPAAWTIGPRAYPPGLPLTLVPLVATFGTHSAVYRLLMLLCVAGFGWVSYLRLCKNVEPWQAALGAGFAMFVFEARGATLAPISDPGFAVIAWGMILLVDATRQWSVARGVVVAMLGAAAVAYRLAGVALLAAFGVYALATWRQHRGRAFVAPIIWAVGALATLLVGAVRISDISTFVAGLQGIGTRLQRYVSTVFDVALYPSTASSINLPYHVISSVLILAGLVILARKTWRSYMAAVCVVYVLMLFTAEVDSGRYAWPLFPVGAAALALGATTVVNFARAQLTASRVPIVAGALLGCVATGATITEIIRPQPPFLVGSIDGESLFTYLRKASATTPMRIVVSNPRVVTLETGVPAMGNVGRSPAGHLAAYEDEHITHFIWKVDSLADCLQRVANTLPTSHPERFVLEYANPTFKVYRVTAAQGPLTEEFRRLRWEEYEDC